MVKLTFISLALATTLVVGTSRVSSAQVCEDGDPGRARIATLNILTKYAPHAPFFGSWETRSTAIAKWVRDQKIEVLATQENVESMLKTLGEKLPGYRVVGSLREDAWFFTDFTALLFDENRFELVKEGTFWLSETPEVPGSKGWDAAFARVCTWAQLKDRRSGGSLFVFSAHFDHVGSKARRESARLMLEKVAEIAGRSPHVMLGDLNTSKNDEALTILKSGLKESRESSLTPPKGEERTYVSGSRLDFVFVDPTMRTCSHEVQEPKTKTGKNVSDHYPVVVDLSPAAH